jgi:hypothetical protein
VSRIGGELVALGREIAAAEEALGEMYEQRDALLREGVALGWPTHQLAKWASVSVGRVSQVAPRPKTIENATDTAAERETAPENLDAPSRVTYMGHLAGTKLLSDRYSQHEAKPYGRRPTIWVDTASGEWIAEMGAGDVAPHSPAGMSLRDVLSLALFNNATRVFLVGEAPVAEGETGDAGIRAWFLTDPGNNWAVAPTGHHLESAKTPTGRYVLGANAMTVEIMRTAAWWGEQNETVGDARAAWFTLQEKVQEAFGQGARLLATPATTGRDLWQRTIGPRTTYPVLSDELREFFHDTSGQGRIELLDPPAEMLFAAQGAHRDMPQIPGVHVRDGRLMYAALTWGMPVGAPTLLSRQAIKMMTGEQLHKAIMGRSRWHVAGKVPADWTRPFGLFMVPRETGTGWHYPAEPGQSYQTWCDGAELALAMSQGWRPTLLEGMTFKEGKPLNVWSDKLQAIWRGFERYDDERIGRLCQRAIRSLLLFSIGAFASRGRTATFTVPEDQAERVPAGVQVHRAGDMLVWTQDAPATSWSQQLAHPEWSAMIWARARVRLLDGPGVKGEGRTGALHLPPGVDVMGFRTDALVLTGDPGWGDDGAFGRLRYDGEITGPFDWPETETELLRLKTAAQKARS